MNSDRSITTSHALVGTTDVDRARKPITLASKTRPTRRFLTTALAATGLLLAGTRPVLGEGSPPATSPVVKINAEAAKAELKTEPLRGNLSVLMGSGGNIGVFVSRDGKLMVDAGIAVSRSRIAEALDKLGPGSVKFVINTHWHWDHTDGNSWLHETGATLVAHENTLKRLSAVTRIDDWDFTFPSAPEGARPTSLVESDKSMSFGGEMIDIRYYGPCHTDSDVYVYFHAADVLFTGDTFWNGVYPFIDTATGGSIDGMIRAAKTNLALATEHTLVVSGHGPVGNRAQLLEYRDMLAAIRSNVASLKKQGKSLAQVIAARPTRAFDARWGNFVIDPAFFTRLVYKSL